MKKILTSAFVLLMISALFIGCKKDDDSTPANSITITGEFTIGDKTYTNPTFDLGEPALHEGYVRPNYQYHKEPVSNMIYIEPVDQFDLGNNIVLNYDYSIYSDAVGTDIPSSAYVGVYLNLEKGDGIWLYSQELSTTITKVGEIGDYIEGIFEGDFYPGDKGVVPTTYPVKGTFKVKRIEYVTK